MTRAVSFAFLKEQIKKTRLNPTRVPLIIGNYWRSVFGSSVVGAKRWLSRSPALVFLTTQIAKTYRNPRRIPSVIAKRVGRFGQSLRNLFIDRFERKVSGLSPDVLAPGDALLPQLDGATENVRSLFEAGARALNNLQISDAVRLLTRAMTVRSAEPEIDDLWIRREAAKHLGVALHHGLGRLDEAVCCWRGAVRFTNSFICNYHMPDLDRAEIYDNFWTTHIGHTAILGIMVEHDILRGEAKKKRYLIRAPAQSVGNPYLVEQMSRFCEVVDHIPNFPLPEGYTAAFGKFFWIDNRPSGPTAYAWQVLAEVSRAWEDKGLGPLFTLSHEEVESIKAHRAALGVPRDAWHVCLHVRSPGYKLSHDDLHAALNADIGTYNLAIAAIVQRGGWVIRMGDPAMPKLPVMRNVVDYAHSPQRSAKMDILMAATSRFFLGTSSGPLYVPALYGVPSVVTNWFPTGTRPLNSSDLFIPKLHRYDYEEELAPFDESMSQPLGHLHNLLELAERGISLLPNLREEVRDVVEEMLDRLDGKAEYTDQDRLLQSQFDKVALQSRSYGNARVGRDFLRKYQCLLPQTLTRS